MISPGDNALLKEKAFNAFVSAYIHNTDSENRHRSFRDNLNDAGINITYGEAKSLAYEITNNGVFYTDIKGNEDE